MSLINTAVIEHNQPLIDQQNKTANDIQQLKQDISNLKQEVAASLSSLQTKLTETISNTIQHTLSSLQLSNPLEENEEYLITPTKKRRTRNRL
jgi:predicted PurR-regulated permease PerM